MFSAPVAKTRRRRTPMAHIPDGWPHKSTHTHMCICLDICCQSDEEGCICKVCPCRYGFSHDQALAVEKAHAPTVEDQRTKRRNTKGSNRGAKE